MKTDSFFYRFFLAFPEAFFQLVGQTKRKARDYKFISVEVKDVDFRFDGIFMPKSKGELIYCVETQFQKRTGFYPSLFAKIANYLQKHEPPNDWCAIVIYPGAAEDTGVHRHYREFFESGRLQRVYLADLPEEALKKFPLNLLKIIVASKRQVITAAEEIVRQLPRQISNEKQRSLILELLASLLVSKLPEMSRKEIEKMLELADIKKSRFYREVEQEITTRVEQRKARAVAQSMLKKNFSLDLIAEVTGLSQKEVAALRRKAI